MFIDAVPSPRKEEEAGEDLHLAFYDSPRRYNRDDVFWLRQAISWIEPLMLRESFFLFPRIATKENDNRIYRFCQLFASTYSATAPFRLRTSSTESYEQMAILFLPNHHLVCNLWRTLSKVPHYLHRRAREAIATPLCAGQ